MRRRPIIVVIFIAAILGIIYLVNWRGTSDAGEDQGKTLDKDGSVETSISVEHADSTHDIILTSHKVWIGNKQYAVIVHRDTVPGLDSLTTTAGNDNGNSTQVRVKKDYQLFITVK
jgi:hypothetical protein